jgi:hypothetical protein
LTVRDGKEDKDRYTMLAQTLIPVLREHLAGVRLRHEDVSTTMIYTHVAQQGGCGMKSPLDSI